MRVTPNGDKSTWSATPVSDLLFTQTGQAYAAGGMSCNCIHSMLPDGSPTTLHADANPWAFLALGNDGTLYATIMAGFGQGLYTVDRVTGTPTLLKSGGPGPNGTGLYRSLMVGMDGELYASGNMNGPGLLRFDGGQFTMLAAYPKTGHALAQDADGFFYTVSQTNNIFGGFSHEVWRIDPTDWSCTLLADGPTPAAAIAYDAERDRLYVSTIYGTVYYITRVPVPTRPETWGAVKARFR